MTASFDAPGLPSLPAGETLPDFMRPDLRAVCIGLNPSPMSTASGVYFANPRNRFWAAARGAGLVPPTLEPGPAAMRHLFEARRIGFTDVVKRTTPGAAQLRAADFRRWAPRLRVELERYRPGVAWFQGKLAWHNFCRHALAIRPDAAWGWQVSPWPDIAVFVTPNPSPANAAYSLEELTGWFRTLAAHLDTLD